MLFIIELMYFINKVTYLPTVTIQIKYIHAYYYYLQFTYITRVNFIIRFYVIYKNYIIIKGIMEFVFGYFKKSKIFTYIFFYSVVFLIEPSLLRNQCF